MNETDIAWAAGFFDGEGSVSIYPEKDKRKGNAYKNWRPCLQVSNTCDVSLRRLKDVFGGFGHIGVLQAATERHSQQFHYMVRRQEHLIPICLNLLRHCTTKRAALEVFLAFCISRGAAKMFKGRGRRAPYSQNEFRLIDRLKSLNKKPYDRSLRN